MVFAQHTDAFMDVFDGKTMATAICFDVPFKYAAGINDRVNLVDRRCEIDLLNPKTKKPHVVFYVRSIFTGWHRCSTKLALEQSIGKEPNEGPEHTCRWLYPARKNPVSDCNLR